MSIVSWLMEQHERTAEGYTMRNGRREGDVGLSAEPLEDPPSVWVLLSGGALDHELIALACAMAKQRHTSRVRAIYGIEVPRTRRIDDDMPVERAQADAILASATDDAAQLNVLVERECILTRDIGDALVHAAAAAQCGALLVGVPYRAEGDDEAHLSETVEDVLRRARCRVCVVRGRQPISADANA